MSLSDWLSLVGLGFTVISALFGGLWVLNKNIQKQFSSMREEQSHNYHAVDIRLTRIDTTVSPYAADIQTMKTTQHENVVAIQELKGWLHRIEKLERQVDSIQDRLNK